MNLTEFVAETLSEILEGIRTAQKKEGGEAIGAHGLGATTSGLLVRGNNDVFTIVEFDVSVVAETSGGGKGSLKVWSVGAIEGGAKRSDQQRAGCGLLSKSKSPRATRPRPLRDLSDDRISAT